jgi:hypothetical protein
MKASSLSFQAAVLFVLAGMGWGIQMGVTHDHSAFPAHAHLNVLGWVSLFLFGVYYHLNPSLDKTGAARTQVCIWIVGTITMTIGIGLVFTGHEEAGDPVVAVGSFIVFAAMLFFGCLVFRCERDRTRQPNAIYACQMTDPAAPQRSNARPRGLPVWVRELNRSRDRVLGRCLDRGSLS